MDEPICTCHKTKERAPEEVKKLLNRLSRIEGQIRGIRGMVEKDAYCPDILIQSAAVTAAHECLQPGSAGQPHPHLRGHDIRAGKDEVIDELVLTLQKLMK